MQMDETGFPSLSTSSPTVAFLHSPARRSETNSRGRRDLNPIEVTALRALSFSEILSTRSSPVSCALPEEGPS